MTMVIMEVEYDIGLEIEAQGKDARILQDY